MEIVVKNALKTFLNQNEIPCKCELCQADIMAHTLNRLPPRYYVSLKGEILTSWASQGAPDQVRVMAEIVRAAQLIGNSPSHPLNIQDAE